MSTDKPQALQLSPTDALKKNIKAMENQFSAALPKHIKSEKFTRVVMTAISNEPKLVNLERASFFSACMKAAQDGLLPDSNEAAIVPFKGKAKYMPMVAGLRKKARNSGEISYLTGDVVYKNDVFEYYISHGGLHFLHKPNLDDERTEPRGSYSFAKLKDGEISVEYMNKKQIADVKKMSKGENTPWNGPFWDQMWIKTVMRRHSKVLPTSADLDMALKSDDDMYDVTPPSAEPEKIAAPSSPNNLLNKIDENETIETTATPVETAPDPAPDSSPEASQSTVSDDEIPI